MTQGLVQYQSQGFGLNPMDEDMSLHPNKQKSFIGDPESAWAQDVRDLYAASPRTRISKIFSGRLRHE